MAEVLTLDGLQLNDSTVFRTEAPVSMTPPPKKPEWVSGADTDGALLARPSHYENRVIELPVRVIPQASADLVLAKIALLTDKLQECEQNEDGLPLVWTPSNATISVTFRCLYGEISDLPIDFLWSVSRSPLVTIRLICLPFGEGAETLLGSVTNSDPLQWVEVSGVKGDVPALGRGAVTDAASQSRRWVLIGMESRWYPTSSPPSLIVDSTSMVTGAGYAGVTGTRTGAYSGASNNVITATLRTQVQAICGLGNLSHVGEFRPQLRFYASATTVAVRLTWQALDGPFRSLSYRVPVTTGWNHVDLGHITVPQTVLGTQRWTGRIEAYSTATGGETLDVDVLWPMPAERIGLARASYAYRAGVLTGIDGFTGRTAGAALGGTTAEVGGTWATSGAATDFIAADGPDTGDETISRSPASEIIPRYAILGATNYTDSEVGVRYRGAAFSGNRQHGVIARWVDANNHLRLTRHYSTSVGLGKVEVVVAGVTTTLVELRGPAMVLDTWFKVRLIVWASGAGVATWQDANGATLEEARFQHASLATGGALATGKPGIYDLNTSASANPTYFDDFYAATPTAEPIVCYSGQSIEFRHDTVLRKDSTGTYAGPPPEYIGGRFLIPPAGDANRKARIAVMAKRNDVAVMPDDNIADSTTLAVYGVPRYLVVPRA